jgi:hypothetical protein
MLSSLRINSGNVDVASPVYMISDVHMIIQQHVCGEYFLRLVHHSPIANIIPLYVVVRKKQPKFLLMGMCTCDTQHLRQLPLLQILGNQHLELILSTCPTQILYPIFSHGHLSMVTRLVLCTGTSHSRYYLHFIQL